MDDVLVVWKLNRLGRNCRHLINTAYNLDTRGSGNEGVDRPRRNHRYHDVVRPVPLFPVGSARRVRTRFDRGTHLGWVGRHPRAEPERETTLEADRRRIRYEPSGGAPAATVGGPCRAPGDIRQTQDRNVGPKGGLRSVGETCRPQSAKRSHRGMPVADRLKAGPDRRARPIRRLH